MHIFKEIKVNKNINNVFLFLFNYKIAKNYMFEIYVNFTKNNNNNIQSFKFKNNVHLLKEQIFYNPTFFDTKTKLSL